MADTEKTEESTSKPEENGTVFDCATCADKGEVSIVVETFTGKRLLPVACPDCKDKPGSRGRIRMEQARDTAIRELDDRIKTLGRVLAIVIVVGALAYLLSRDQAESPFVRAVKEEVTGE